MRSLGKLLPIDHADVNLFGEACRRGDVGLLAGRPDLQARYELSKAVRLVDDGQEQQARELLAANPGLPASVSEILEERIKERQDSLARQERMKQEADAWIIARQRNKLVPLTDRRAVYQATFERYGSKSAFRGPPLKTLLFKNVRVKDGDEVADHLWFNDTVEFQAASLEPGDVVEFTARASAYERGYFGRRDDVEAGWGKDFKLSRPTKVTVLRRKNVGA